MTFPELLNEALKRAERLRAQYPESRPISSVVDQLKYLIGLESGAISDQSKLGSINIGIIAAREIEDLDLELAEMLHEISAEVSKRAGSR